MLSSSEYLLKLILRFSVFGTFFGHGSLAFGFEPKWLPYLRVVGIGEKTARLLMPTIGLMDIIIAFICMLMEPSPLIYCWATVWGFSTAVMRPLSGESIFGLIERTGNFCPALALLWLASGQLFNYYLSVCGIMIGGLIVSGFIFRQTGIFSK